MPSITLTPSACTSGTSGWINLYYHSTNQNSAQPRQLIFTVPANATLGGAGVNITGITLHAYVRNSASAVKQLQYGCKTGTGAAPTAWAQINGANVLDGAFTAVDHGNGSYIYKYVSRALSGAALERFAAHMQARFFRRTGAVSGRGAAAIRQIHPGESGAWELGHRRNV